MDHRGTPGGWDSPANRPTVVEVTVVAGAGRRGRDRRTNVFLAGLGTLPALAVAAVIAVLPAGGRGSAPPRARTPTPGIANPRGPFPGAPSQPPPPNVLVDSGPPSATAPSLYRIPLGCLASTVAGVEQREAAPCARGGPYVTAVLRRVGGTWRVRLTPASPSCPQMPLPAQMRRNLTGCRR